MNDDNNTIAFMTFRVSDGKLLQTMEASRIQLLDAQCSDDVDWILGHYDPEIYRVADGQAVLKTENE